LKTPEHFGKSSMTDVKKNFFQSGNGVFKKKEGNPEKKK